MDPAGLQPLDPEGHRPPGDGESGGGHLPRPPSPRAPSGPREEGKDRPRTTSRIAEVEVVCRRVVVVDRELHEPQSQDARVKIEIPLRLARDRSHMMDTRYRICHGNRPFVEDPPAFPVLELHLSEKML